MNPARTLFLCVCASAASLRLSAQCPDGAPPPCRGAARASAPTASIAVLYFDNLSRDTGDVYLADGFSEEVMSRLGQVEGLQVKSRTAVQRHRSRPDADPLAAGRSLNVAHLVSGSVLRQRGRLRVTVELTRVSSGNRVWGGSFDRTAEDLITTEAEIAESVAVNVGARLAPAEIRRIEERPTRNAAAYDHLLRGRFEQSRRTTASLLAAARHYEAALRLDSMLTTARLGLANSYALLANLYYTAELGLPRESLMVTVRRERARALRQDSTSVEAMLMLAAGRDAEQSIPWLARAVAAWPRSADAHHNYALSLRQVGRDSLAIAELRRAVDIEPDRAISLLNLGQTYLMLRRYPEARRWIDSAIAQRPEAAFFYKEGALVRLLMGDTAGARTMAAQVASRGGAMSSEQVLAMIEAREGDSSSARARAVRIDSAVAQLDCVISHDCLEAAMALAAVGRRDGALAVLERMTPRNAWLAYWCGRPEFDGIREEPRFQRLMAEARASR